MESVLGFLQRQVMRTPAEKPCAPKEEGAGEFNNSKIDPTPLAITEVRKISSDSVLIKWERPTNNHIKGYEIEVDSKLKAKIHSSSRDATVLNGILMDTKVMVSIYAISLTGTRCQPPATIIYHPRPSSPEEKACRT